MSGQLDNIVPLFINSADRANIGDSPTDFTIALRKSLRNIAAVSVSGVVIPQTNTIIGPNNDILIGAVIVDGVSNPFSVSLIDGDYTPTTLAAELQSELNANADMAAYPLTWTVTYDPVANRMVISVAYPFGASHTWSISIGYTSLVDVIGIGNAGTTAQVFTATPGATTLTIPCNRVPVLLRELALNITRARLTNNVNTSYVQSLGKFFNINGGNDLIRVDSMITTNAHSTIILPPPTPVAPILQALGRSLSMSTNGLILAAGSLQYGAFIFTRPNVSTAWALSTVVRDDAYLFNAQGANVALAGDGTTLAFDATQRVYVYVRSGPSWTQQTVITNTSIVSATVSLSADGSTLAIAMFFGGLSGRVDVYTRTAGVWTFQQTLTNPVGTVVLGSGGVSLSATGNRLAVGDADFGSAVGYIFLRTAGVWALEATLVPGDAVGGAIVDVGISSNELYAAFASPGDNGGAGATFVYFNGAPWAEQQKIVVTSGTVALNTTGDTLVIGAPNANANIGYTHMYSRVLAVWSAQATNQVGTGAIGTSHQGTDVVISGVGNDIVTGGPGDNGSRGALWSFHRATGVWSQVGANVTASADTLHFNGSSVSMSGDALTIACGFPSKTTVVVYVVNGLEWVVQAEITPTAAIGTTQFGISVSLSFDGNTLAIGGPLDNTGVGAVWIYARTGSTWLFMTKIVGVGSNELGGAVALSGSANLLVIANASAGPDGLRILTHATGVWVEQAANIGVGQWGGFPPSDLDISLNEQSVIGSTNGAGAVVFDFVAGAWQQSGPNFATIHTPIGASVIFGTACAIAPTGLLALVSDPGDVGNKGVVFIFTRSAVGSPWAETGNLQSADTGTGGDLKGISVALINNGLTAIVGGSGYTTPPVIQTGAIWVYDFNGATWVQRPGVITGFGNNFGAIVAGQPAGLRYIGVATSAPGLVVEFAPAGTTYAVTTDITVPNGAYTIFDMINLLNTLMTDALGSGAGFSVSFDGLKQATITGVTHSPITSITLKIDPASTFTVARWLSTSYASSQTSAGIDFSINNNVIKHLTTHTVHTDNTLVDNTVDIQFRKYAAGYTVDVNDPIDFQLRDDRDRIINLNGANWICTVYATVRS